jgi:hypothetical protein
MVGVAGSRIDAHVNRARAQGHHEAIRRGIAGCMASADVLRSVNVEAREGDAMRSSVAPGPASPRCCSVPAGLMVPSRARCAGSAIGSGECRRARQCTSREGISGRILSAASSSRTFISWTARRVARRWSRESGSDRAPCEGRHHFACDSGRGVAGRLATRSLTLRAGSCMATVGL